MSVGKQIRTARERLGLTQRQLALELGITPSAVANYENDISRPREPLFVKLFSALGIDANYIYSDVLEAAGVKAGARPDNESRNDAGLSKYIALDAHGKKVVDTVLELEYSRVMKDKR